jgi:hypothetical protein
MVSGSSRIRREVIVDGLIVVPQGTDIINIEVVSFIHNDGEDHYAVGGSGPRHAWQVLDDKQRVIYREASEAVEAGGALVPSRLHLREAETLEVPANKLANGKRYTVRHLHWGHVAEAEFIVVKEPKLAAKKTAKKAAKRKAAKKKAAKRKS